MSALFKRYWAACLAPAVPDADKEAILKMCIVHSSKPGIDIDDMIQGALLTYLETRGNLTLVKKAIYASLYTRPVGHRAKFTATCIMELNVADDLAMAEGLLEAFTRLDVISQIVVWFLDVVEVRQSELAAALKLSQPQVSRVRRIALRELRDALR